MNISVRNRCDEFTSYRAARVHSLFNADANQGANFSLDATLDIDDTDWKLGLIVGPSGSGKTSMGRQIFPGSFYEPSGWDAAKPIIDCISPDGGFDDVTGALAAVGLGSVPSWLRPYSVLSNGEKFRADLARIVSEAPAQVVVDEFTSVVDRQIAKIGALAFQKSWRRTGGQAVLLSCHYDIIDWLEPDWVFDTSDGSFRRGRLWRRPKFDLEIYETDWSYWPMFEPHHYLKLPRMIASRCYVGFVNDAPVVHLAMSTSALNDGFEGRACRMVVLPEWQGAGVGMRFLNAICDMWLRGENKHAKPMTTIFHTSHPGLCAALRRDPKWRQLSARLYGVSEKTSSASSKRSRRRKADNLTGLRPEKGYGGHMRAVQGFRYYGDAGVKAAAA